MRGFEGLDVGDRVRVELVRTDVERGFIDFAQSEGETMSAIDPERSPLAYKNEEFLDSDDARPLRILAEYLQPLHAFQRERICGTIVFFGSARIAADGPLGRYYDEARELARLVTAWSREPAVSRRSAASSAPAAAPASWRRPTAAPPMPAAGPSASTSACRTSSGRIRTSPRELSFEFHYFFMRKLWFAHLARALVVFPGGFGTLDELFEILTLAQTQKLERPIPVVLYGPDYWNEIINFEALVRHGMIDREDLALFDFADDPAPALTLLQEGQSRASAGGRAAGLRAFAPAAVLSGIVSSNRPQTAAADREISDFSSPTGLRHNSERDEQDRGGEAS